MQHLHSARVRLHAATQGLARLAYAYAAPAGDDSHAALRWDDGHLQTAPLAGAGAARLHPVSLALTLGERTVSLEGADEGARRDAVADVSAAAGLDPARIPAALPWAGEAPDADPARDAQVPAQAQQALAGQYDAAAELLTRFAAGTPGASPVRLWPHHLDIATLVSLTGTPESVGVGLAPDDGQFDDAYYYVTPWPYPAPPLPPAPPPWRWHTAGFTALVAVLAPGSQPPALPDLEAAVALARHTGGQQG
jgi:hypothetical protein